MSKAIFCILCSVFFVLLLLGGLAALQDGHYRLEAEIDRLTDELKAKDEIIQVVLRNVKAGAVTTQWVESYIEQALKGEK